MATNADNGSDVNVRISAVSCERNRWCFAGSGSWTPRNARDLLKFFNSTSFFTLCSRKLPRVINFKFPWSLTRNITSHSMENLAFHSFLRWKMILLPILTTSLIRYSLKGWESLLFGFGSERVKFPNVTSSTTLLTVLASRRQRTPPPGHPRQTPPPRTRNTRFHLLQKIQREVQQMKGEGRGGEEGREEREGRRGRVQTAVYSQTSLLWTRLTLSLLRVINVKIPLQPHKKYDITQYGELDFS